ncbi:hypothetical protein [Clostridium perfringens]|uniref:hypothetical protein n=1 Tax=Clostridium perfringens TaxID=1502 RepID=UPI002AC7AE22|nr:hypothetical protein [Clostridium perfringens]
MKYKFTTAEVYNQKRLVMEFFEEHEMLTNIFNEVVLWLDNKIDWLDAIEDSIKGNSEKHDFGVPGFGAEVGKEKTIIYCDFTDEEIEITTEKFKRISEIWFDSLEEFKKTGKLKVKEGFID